MQADQSEPPDYELLAKIKGQANSPEEIDAAWQELYARHSEFLYRCLLKEKEKLERFGLDIEEIVFQTFQKVYRTRAKSFRQGTYVDAESARNHVTSWLLEIARKLLIDAVRRPKSVQTTFIDPTEPSNSLSRAECSTDVDEYIELHHCVRNTLTEEQQEVLWFFNDHYSTQTGKSHPPKELLTEFSGRMNSNPTALRKSYERIKSKLAESLKPIYK